MLSFLYLINIFYQWGKCHCHFLSPFFLQLQNGPGKGQNVHIYIRAGGPQQTFFLFLAFSVHYLSFVCIVGPNTPLFFWLGLNPDYFMIYTFFFLIVSSLNFSLLIGAPFFSNICYGPPLKPFSALVPTFIFSDIY